LWVLAVGGFSALCFCHCS